jgi:hypothetical protein
MSGAIIIKQDKRAFFLVVFSLHHLCEGLLSLPPESIRSDTMDRSDGIRARSLQILSRRERADAQARAEGTRNRQRLIDALSDIMTSDAIDSDTLRELSACWLYFPQGRDLVDRICKTLLGTEGKRTQESRVDVCYPCDTRKADRLTLRFPTAFLLHFSLPQSRLIMSAPRSARLLHFAFASGSAESIVALKRFHSTILDLTKPSCLYSSAVMYSKRCTPLRGPCWTS